MHTVTHWLPSQRDRRSAGPFPTLGSAPRHSPKHSPKHSPRLAPIPAPILAPAATVPPALAPELSPSLVPATAAPALAPTTAPTPVRQPAARRAARVRQRSTVGFMERRVGMSALLTAALLVAVGLVLGLAFASVVLHALSALGVHHTGATGTADPVGRLLSAWTL